MYIFTGKKINQKAWESHNHKLQPFYATKRNRKKKKTHKKQRIQDKQTKSRKENTPALSFWGEGFKMLNRDEKHENEE